LDPEQDLKQRIVATALALAEPRSWEVVRLHEVAEAAGITLDELRVHFREKEDIVEAWFDRADAAMLHAATAPGFLTLTTRQRLRCVIMAWLNALAAHRRVTRQMILGKLEPGHLHIQIPGIMRVSRTVQWFREAAHRDAAYVQRAFEEVATTSIYLATFCYWMYDDSPGAAATEAFLELLLGIAERIAHATVGRSAAVPAGTTEPPP